MFHGNRHVELGVVWDGEGSAVYSVSHPTPAFPFQGHTSRLLAVRETGTDGRFCYKERHAR